MGFTQASCPTASIRQCPALLAAFCHCSTVTVLPLPLPITMPPPTTVLYHLLLPSNVYHYSPPQLFPRWPSTAFLPPAATHHCLPPHHHLPLHCHTTVAQLPARPSTAASTTPPSLPSITTYLPLFTAYHSSPPSTQHLLLSNSCSHWPPVPIIHYLSLASHLEVLDWSISFSVPTHFHTGYFH